MKLKCFFVVFTIFMSSMLTGQSLDEYKYIIIPAKFDFQKTDDQYQLNSLAKFLFEKEGFKTQFDNLEMPADIAKNPCDVLTAHVDNTSSMFTTKIVIELINCKNQKVLISKEGRSKEKEYKKGYHEALREAFESVTAQNYNYKKSDTKVSTNNVIENSKNDVLEAAANAVGEAKNTETVEATEAETPEEIEITEVEEIEETEIVASNDVAPKKYDKRDRDDKGNLLSIPTEKMLYAQANRLGYQLVDSSPKIVFILLNSGKKDVYYLKNRSGNFFKEGDKWYAEYYFDGHLTKQEFDVKW